MHHSSYSQLFEDMHGLPKPSILGLRTSDIFEQKGNEKQTFTYPLVLSSWQVVVLTSSLENNRKNWTTIVGFVFLAIFSWFFHPQKWEVCFEHIFDFEITLIFSWKIEFCQIFLHFSGELTSTTTCQLGSTNGHLELCLRVPYSRKFPFFIILRSCKSSLVWRGLTYLPSSSRWAYDAFITNIFVEKCSLPPTWAT